MCGNYTYIGYVHATGEDDDEYTIILPTDEQEQGDINERIMETIVSLCQQGVIDKEHAVELLAVPFKQILFTHYW